MGSRVTQPGRIGLDVGGRETPEPPNTNADGLGSCSPSPEVQELPRQVPRGRRGPQQQVPIAWQWINTFPGGNYNPKNVPFQGQPGLRNPLPEDSKPIDYFTLYFTQEIVQKICDETNRYAHQFIHSQAGNLKPHSLVHDWKDTTPVEIKTFLGLCILMGLIYKPRIWMYWSKDALYNTPLFSQLMSRNRFLILNKFLHFQDNQDPQYNPQDPNRDRLFKIRDIMDMMKEKFNIVYYPPENLTVDESLILYKGRLLFRQYIKSKRSRFGIKFYEMSTTDGILLDFILYQGHIGPGLIDPPGEDWLQTERIPLTLIAPYLDRGHTLTIDNFYTTPRLAKYLLERQTKTVGTIRPNRKMFPKDFPADNDMPKGSAVFKGHENILAMKYRAAQNKSQNKPKVVHLLSTKHKPIMKNTSRRDHEGNIIQKPEAIIYYNHNMGGVDKIDQQLHCINVVRKTFKWYHKVFFRLLSVAMLSSHKIYNKNGGREDFLQFVHEIVQSLVEDSPHLHDVRKRNDNLVRLTGRHFPAQSLYEGQATKKKHKPKNCRVCYAKGKRTDAGHILRSNYYCPDCPEKPGLCIGDCFRSYHTKLDYTQ